MIQTARKRPVMERLQPRPWATFRRKKGRGTSNHKSRAPNRKNLEGRMDVGGWE
jgi:hypothetical protein